MGTRVLRVKAFEEGYTRWSIYLSIYKYIYAKRKKSPSSAVNPLVPTGGSSCSGVGPGPGDGSKGQALCRRWHVAAGAASCCLSRDHPAVPSCPGWLAAPRKAPCPCCPRCRLWAEVQGQRVAMPRGRLGTLPCSLLAGASPGAAAAAQPLQRGCLCVGCGSQLPAAAMSAWGGGLLPPGLGAAATSLSPPWGPPAPTGAQHADGAVPPVPPARALQGSLKGVGFTEGLSLSLRLHRARTAPAPG